MALYRIAGVVAVSRKKRGSYIIMFTKYAALVISNVQTQF
jgi:hypothetical protein